MSELQHPILGNFVLPVEVENPTKISGPHNLRREGWCEESPSWSPSTLLKNRLTCQECRLYLTRIAAWVPRNFSYEDGVRMLHPMLQERFGDENLDLAVGVLEELIEIEALPPFPESIYQRWKFHHMRSMDNLRLPHVPHSPTIVLKPHTTERLKQWRRDNLGIPARPDLINRPTFSNVAHLPVWKIEHTMFTSVGGERVSVYYRPTPEELHRRYWDPDYGRAGTSEGGKKLLEAANSEKSLPKFVTAGTNVPADNTTAVPKSKSLDVASIENDVPKSGHPRYIGFAEPQSSHVQTRGSLIINARLPALAFRASMSPGIYPAGSDQSRASRDHSTLSNDTRESVEEIPLPVGFVPNGSFVRKHALVHEDEPLPLQYLHGLPQLTLDEKILKQCIRTCGRVMYEVTRLTALNDDEKRKCQNQRVQEYLCLLECPPSPGLFYDGGEDFKWIASATTTQHAYREISASAAPSCKAS